MTSESDYAARMSTKTLEVVLCWTSVEESKLRCQWGQKTSAFKSRRLLGSGKDVLASRRASFLSSTMLSNSKHHNTNYSTVCTGYDLSSFTKLPDNSSRKNSADTTALSHRIEIAIMLLNDDSRNCERTNVRSSVYSNLCLLAPQRPGHTEREVHLAQEASTKSVPASGQA